MNPLVEQKLTNEIESKHTGKKNGKWKIHQNSKSILCIYIFIF